MIMETGLNLSFKQLRLAALFFLLISLQLQFHLILALPLNSMVAPDLNEEENGEEAIEAKKLSLSIKLGGKHELKVVRRRGGGAAGAAHGGGGGEHGGGAGAAAGGDNGGGRSTSTNGEGGAVIPVYAAGAMNHNRYHHHHGSSSGTMNCIGSSFLVLIIFTSFFLV